MPFSDRPWFLLGLLIVISLFATVSALTIQIALGRNFTTVLIGPVIAVIAVLAFYRLQGAGSQK
jgi:hypothetical protein